MERDVRHRAIVCETSTVNCYRKAHDRALTELICWTVPTAGTASRIPTLRQPWTREASPLLDERAVSQLAERLLQLLLACSSRSARTTPPAPRSACPRRAGTGFPRRQPARPPRRRGRRAPAIGSWCRGRARCAPVAISSVSTPCGSEASRNVPDPANTYANAWRDVSTARRFRLTGRHPHVEVSRIGRDAFDRPLPRPRTRRKSPARACHHRPRPPECPAPATS